MALRKPLAFNATDAFHEEVPITDTMQLGGLTLTGNLAFSGGVSKVTGSAAGTTNGDGLVYGQSAAALTTLTMAGVIAMGSNKITGLAAGSVSGDALMYGQSAAALAGLTMSGNIAMGSNKVTGLAAGTVSGDALMYGQSSASLAGLTLTGNLVMGTNLITGLGTPVSSSDAATKAYVDSLAITGASWTSSVDVVAVANQATVTGTAQTIDGVALNTIGMRVLLTAQASPINNGIWVVAAGAWTRGTDLAAGVDAANKATFIEAGTTYADSGWMCTSNTGSAVVGTNNLSYVQITAAGQILAGNGLTKTGNTISTKAGDGIEITSNANSTNVGLDAVSPGLQFTGSAGTGRLQVKTVSTGGVEVVAGGVQIKLNGATLATGASGASVLGVPSLFTINAIAVSANVTAANLGTLTAGVASNADALHTHTALTVTGANSVQHVYTSVDALSSGDPVSWSTTNNQVNKARSDTDAKSRVVGVNKNAAVGAAGSCTFFSHGPNPGVLVAAVAGTAYYLASTGGLTTTYPASGANLRVIEVGVALNTTDLFVRILDWGKRP
jgi:hypothetical protein